MTPDVRFGRPAVHGISTDVIWEHDEAERCPDRHCLRPHTRRCPLGSGVRDVPAFYGGVSESGGHHYRPATVRFYVDADVLGLAKILVQIRADVTYPAILEVTCSSGAEKHARSPRLPRWIPSGSLKSHDEDG